MAAVGEIIPGQSRQEIATNELKTLLDISEIVATHISVYAELEALTGQQEVVVDPNLELFDQIQKRLDILREVWTKRYKLVTGSVASGNLDWHGDEKGRHKGHFWYSLLVNGEPAIQFERGDRYDGDIEVFNLRIYGPDGAASSAPEVVDRDTWSSFTRYHFSTANISGGRVQYVNLNFEEVLVKDGVPENWHRTRGFLYVDGEKILKPASVSKQDTFSVPQIGRSFKLTAFGNIQPENIGELPIIRQLSP